MSSRCPAPPKAIVGLPLHTEIVSPGTILYRFHGFDAATGQYAGDAFNPYLRRGLDWTVAADGARFSPFPAEPGPGYLPGLYAAADMQSAIFETIFHDVEIRPDVEVYWDRLVRKQWHLSTLEVQLPITVVALTAPNLRAARLPTRPRALEPGELINSAPDNYPRTRGWARAIHYGVADTNGMRYASRLGDGMAYVFYDGPRWPARALIAQGAPISIEDDRVKEDVKSAATAAHIRILFRSP